MSHKFFHRLLFSIVFTVFFFFGCSRNLPPKTETSQPILIFNRVNQGLIGELKIFIASTPEEQFQGLRNIAYLPKDEGMLFPFNPPKKVTFVMGQVKIPLNMFFIDQNNKIIQIASAPACEKTDQECDKYPSISEVRYVLETNLGLAKEYNINIGDYIEITR